MYKVAKETVSTFGHLWTNFFYKNIEKKKKWVEKYFFYLFLQNKAHLRDLGFWYKCWFSVWAPWSCILKFFIFFVGQTWASVTLFSNNFSNMFRTWYINNFCRILRFFRRYKPSEILQTITLLNRTWATF